MKTLYDLLEITPSATEQNIKQAFKRLTKRFFDSRNKGDKPAEDTFIEILQTKKILLDAQKRKEYDAWLIARYYTSQFFESTSYDAKEIDNENKIKTFFDVVTDIMLETERKPLDRKTKDRHHKFTIVITVGALVYSFFLRDDT